MRIISFFGGVVALLLSACGPIDRDPPPFNAQRAFGHLEAQVALGPRVPNSEAAAACRTLLVSHFLEAGLAVDSQVFEVIEPYFGDTLRLVNIIASFRGAGEDDTAVLLMAHYDSRPWADQSTDSARRNEPVAGASDGASGVAILMELATMFKESPPAINVDLVCSDGEDYGRAGDLDWYLLGARHFAFQGIRDKYRFAIVPSLVGDKNQEIYREFISQQFVAPLNDVLWEIAAELGITTWRNEIRHRVYDDQVALNGGGVPSVLIIDFDYPHWHTEFDIPENCSPEALSNVGRVLAYLLYTPSRWPEL